MLTTMLTRHGCFLDALELASLLGVEFLSERWCSVALDAVKLVIKDLKVSWLKRGLC